MDGQHRATCGAHERLWLRAGRGVVRAPGHAACWVIARGRVWAVLPEWAEGAMRELMFGDLALAIAREAWGDDAVIARMGAVDAAVLKPNDGARVR